MYFRNRLTRYTLRMAVCFRNGQGVSGKVPGASLVLDSNSKRLELLLILELLWGPLWSQEGPEGMAAGQIHCNVYSATSCSVSSQMLSQVMQGFGNVKISSTGKYTKSNFITFK